MCQEQEERDGGTSQERTGSEEREEGPKSAISNNGKKYLFVTCSSPTLFHLQTEFKDSAARRESCFFLGGLAGAL